MTSKKVLAIFIVILLILAVATAALFFLIEDEVGDNVLPEPYIVAPRRDKWLPGEVVVIYGDEVQVMALEMNWADDVASTTFEYSIDGGEWTLIGQDDDAYDDVSFSTDPGVVGVFDGFIGWQAEWDISGLSEGAYKLRATMKD
ncbi:MAG: hypothetical protein KAI64_02720, partial [Thermoplasmata archaeon]|nr:hypothetical protein [Thermoplasmata archaeon]